MFLYLGVQIRFVVLSICHMDEGMQFGVLLHLCALFLSEKVPSIQQCKELWRGSFRECTPTVSSGSDLEGVMGYSVV